MSASPTSRTLQALKREGYLAQVTERYCIFSKRRIDLYGCIDVLAVRPGEAPLAVQATSASNHASRVNKALALPALRTWLATGSRFEVWSWKKVGNRWEVRRQAVGESDLPDPLPLPDGPAS